MTPPTQSAETGSAPPRLRDRAMYLAALAVGLAVAGVSETTARDDLRAAAGERRGDLVAARGRLYSSSLATAEHRKVAARLLHLAAEPPAPSRPPRGRRRLAA